MRAILTLALLAAVFPATAPAQGKKEIEPVEVIKLERTDNVLYEKEIEPIFKNKCMVCHSGTEKKGKLDMGTYEALMQGGKRGKAVIPGNSKDSLLVKVAGRTDKPYMPPVDDETPMAPLSPKELAVIKLWIDQGAHAPTTGPGPVAKIIIGLPPANVTPVRAVAVSPDKAFVVAGRGNHLLVWDGAKGDFLRSLTQPDLQTPDKKKVEAAHISLVESLAYSPDGKYLASGSFQEVCIWDVKAGKLEKKLTGFAHNVVALAFSQDSKYLATGGGVPTADGEVKVFDTANWNLYCEIKNGHSDEVFGVAISPDNTKVASCGADKFIKVFELPSGKFLKSFEGHTHHVMDVGWKNDGKLLASAGADNTIKIWNYETGEQIKSVPNAHTKQLTRLQFIGKTPVFATCGGDGVVKFWSVDSGTAAKNFPAAGDFYYAVSVSADGALVAAGGEEGVVRLYNGANGQLIRALPLPGAAPDKK